MSDALWELDVGGGCKAVIVDSCENENWQDLYDPRQWQHLNLARLACWHRKINLGDEQIDTSKWPTAVAATRGFGKCVAIKPLYLYEHGMMTIATSPFSCPWDSGQVGWAYITADRAAERGADKWPAERLYAVIDKEVDTYDAFIRGDVYGYRVWEPIAGEMIGADDGYLDLAECETAARDEVAAYLAQRDSVPYVPVLPPIEQPVRVPATAPAPRRVNNPFAPVREREHATV